jgi:hypothetical protein
LIAYTDGLIERRGEDIDVGIERITSAAADSRGMDPRLVADLLIAGQTAGLGGSGGRRHEWIAGRITV